eukprot:2298620-Pleurochrysis_carterae.AAC.1
MFASIGPGPAGWEDPMLPPKLGTKLRAAPSLGPVRPVRPTCSRSELASEGMAGGWNFSLAGSLAIVRACSCRALRAR